MSKPAARRPRINLVGVIGELLITGGVLVGLFIAWQLWWNDALSAQSQTAAAADLSAEWSAPTPASTATPSTAKPSPGATSSNNPVTLPAPAALGKPFAILYVPRFGPNTQRQIAEGVGSDVLNSTRLGIGHYVRTVLPGEVGNFAIASHRSAYGGGMHLIDKLRVGDAIYVQTKDGWYTYRFRNYEYVKSDGVGILDDIPQGLGVPSGQRIITLITCNPLYSTAERIAAYGIFESWQPNSAGPPWKLRRTSQAGRSEIRKCTQRCGAFFPDRCGSGFCRQWSSSFFSSRFCSRGYFRGLTNSPIRATRRRSEWR